MIHLALLLWSHVAFAQDPASSDTQAATPTVDVDEVPATPPPPVDAALEDLLPMNIDLDALTSAPSETQKAAYQKAVVDLEKSIAKATAAVDASKELLRKASQQYKVAKADVKARGLDVKVAKKELKVQKIEDSGTGERAAERAIEDAKLELSDARKAQDVTSAEIGLQKARLAHAKQVVRLEEAKLEEARARAEGIPDSDVLKLQKVRVKNEAAEAKARAVVADAKAKVERARK